MHEHRLILLISDLAASVVAAFLALYVWKQYSIQTLVVKGIDIDRAERILRIQGIETPFWFYLLPLAWLLLMVELYDVHTAVSSGKTLRGISLAAFLGIVLYALVFIFNQDPSSLPRIAVGAFIILASVFTPPSLIISVAENSVCFPAASAVMAGRSRAISSR